MSFIAEGAPIPVIVYLLSLVKLEPFKIGAITVLSNEMVLGSNA